MKSVLKGHKMWWLPDSCRRIALISVMSSNVQALAREKPGKGHYVYSQHCRISPGSIFYSVV